MKKQMNLWSKIETAPASAAWFSWKLRFGKELPKVLPWFLKRKEGKARTVPCPDHCGCIHRVTEDGFGICDCGDCDPIPLTTEDVQVWEPNWTIVGGRIREAFDLEHKTSKFPVSNVWQVGSFNNDSLHVLLVVHPERGSFNEAVAQLVARVKGRFVILTPTAIHRDLESDELLARVNSGLFDLESIVTVLASGKLVAKKTAGELFSRFLPEQSESINDNEAMRVFALVKALELDTNYRKAPVTRVFQLYCMGNDSRNAVAKKCKCVPSLITLRLKALKKKLGRHPSEFRQLSAHFDKIADSLTDSRAKKVYRKGAIDESPGDDEKND